jgi:hypothetical protein
MYMVLTLHSKNQRSCSETYLLFSWEVLLGPQLQEMSMNYDRVCSAVIRTLTYLINSAPSLICVLHTMVKNCGQH